MLDKQVLEDLAAVWKKTYVVTIRTDDQDLERAIDELVKDKDNCLPSKCS